jgi:hypothetical protein
LGETLRTAIRTEDIEAVAVVGLVDALAQLNSEIRAEVAAERRERDGPGG